MVGGVGREAGRRRMVRGLSPRLVSPNISLRRPGQKISFQKISFTNTTIRIDDPIDRKIDRDRYIITRDLLQKRPQSFFHLVHTQRSIHSSSTKSVYIIKQKCKKKTSQSLKPIK